MPAEGEPARRERGDGAAADVLGDVHRADRDGHRDPRRTRARGSSCASSDGRPTTGTPVGTARPNAPAGSGPSTRIARAPAEAASSTASSDSPPRVRSAARPAIDARALLVEEAADAPGADGARDRRRRPPSPCPSARRRAEARRRRARAAPHARTRARSATPAGRPTAPTVSAEGAPPGPAMLPNVGPASPVVPRGHDDERVERRRSLDRARERPVRERRVRLRDADERDPGRVVRVAVLVRVDRRLEPGEHLVGAGVHGVSALGVRLPARHANRQDRRARRDAVEPSRPVRARRRRPQAPFRGAPAGAESSDAAGRSRRCPA